MHKATSMVSLLPSQSYCPLHSLTLPSWRTVRNMAYNVLVCHVSASLCAESQRGSPGISVNTSGYFQVKSFNIRRWSSDRSSLNLTSQTPFFDNSLVLPPSLGQYFGKSLRLLLWLHHPCYL